MIRSRTIAFAVALAAALVGAGCGEREQTTEAKQPRKKADAKPWEGADSISVAGGWKAGDRKAWEEQMRQRAQGQNEYTRATP